MEICITQHEFLKVAPLAAEKKFLILGTIHPYKPDGTAQFLCPFFYGNKYSLWGILKQAFPYLDIEETSQVAASSVTVKKLCQLLKTYHVALSDTVQVGVRPLDKPSADIFLDGTVYNETLINQLTDAPQLKTIYFTSKKVLEIFVWLYKRVRSQQGIKSAKNLLFPSLTSLLSGDTCVISDPLYLPQVIKGVILPSPSQSGIRGQNKKFKASSYTSYTQWRIDFYHKAFAEVFCLK